MLWPGPASRPPTWNQTRVPKELSVGVVVESAAMARVATLAVDAINGDALVLPSTNIIVNDKEIRRSLHLPISL